MIIAYLLHESSKYRKKIFFLLFLKKHNFHRSKDLHIWLILADIASGKDVKRARLCTRLSTMNPTDSASNFKSPVIDDFVPTTTLSFDEQLKAIPKKIYNVTYSDGS